MKKPQITFSRVPRETGLGRVTQGTRGWHVKVDGKRVGGVSVLTIGLDITSRFASTEDRRWYWYATTGTNHINTASIDDVPVTAAEAKAACKAWLLKELAP